MSLLFKNPVLFLPAALAAAAAILLVLLLVRAWIEPKKLEVVTVQIRRRAEGRQPLASPLRVLLLSDLHAEHLRIKEKEILDACRNARPDLILFAGDLAGRIRSLPAAVSLLRRVREMPDLAGCPFLAVRGNHDELSDMERLRGIGIIPLVNQSARVSVKSQDWLIMGLDDLKTGHPDPPEALADAGGVMPARRILVAHNPDCILDFPDGEAALFLAGHLHGGQIWLPFRLEFHLLRKDKLPKMGYIKGLLNWRGMPMYISRGLGCVWLPLRLFSRPEITVIDVT